MKLTAQHSTLRQTKADAVAIFVPQDAALLRPILSDLRKLFARKIDSLVALEEFKGKENEILSVYTEKKIPSPRLYLVGLGAPEKLSREQYRRAGAAAAKQAASSSVERLAFMVRSESPAPGALAAGAAPTPMEAAEAVAEGALLSQYRFDRYFTEKQDRARKKIHELILCADDASMVNPLRKALHEVKIVCEATCFARDLENAPPNEIYPETLAAAARRSGEQHGFRVEVWDKKRIEAARMGGLLAVNAGSERPARFIILEHNSGREDLDTIVLVGKGITFDAGGISIKPAAGMAEMKMDMSGAAAVIATLEAATRLKIPVHLVGLVPSSENLLGGMAMKPGDIITHYGGKTSEVDNTDAEGRLVLADALAYASTYKPKAVIDLATLTGACVVALGHHATGMMGNDEELLTLLKRAGENTYERVWPLPLFEEYEKQIKSDVADVKNVGGRWGGAITAGLFLKKFVGGYKWAHLDIAGTAILEEPLPYAPKGGSGVGVRLLIDLLKHWNG